MERTSRLGGEDRGSAAEEYPQASVPPHPVLSASACLPGRGRRVPSVLDAGHVIHVMSGRMALALALERLGIGGGDRVLLPAYHCTVLVESVLRVGAVPVFYRVRRDLSPDLADLAAKADERTRAVLAIHYFGFPQDMDELRRFCDARALVLVEDCSHAFFGEREGRPVGSTGDVAIASTWKFLPVQDGGCLVARSPIPGGPPPAPGLALDAKSAVNSLERAWSARRLRILRVLLAPFLWVKEALRARRDRRRAGDAPAGGQSLPRRGPPDAAERWYGCRAPAFTRLVLRMASHRRIAARRRRHYARILESLRDLPGLAPLFPALPEGVVPYVVPVLVQDVEGVFRTLKRRGVPILRFGEALWEGVDERTCPVAAEYSRNVLQFPCHQEMTRGEIDWMISEIRAAAHRAVAPVPEGV